MDPNTFYYTLSTIPQIIAAVVAIMIAVVYFRIGDLKDYLIGEGRVTLRRWTEKGYKFPDEEQDPIQKKRLEDAIDRRSVSEIRHVLKLLRDIEADDGLTKDKSRPRGLQYVYEDRFSGTQQLIEQLQRWAKVLVILSCVIIASSVIPLAAAGAVLSHPSLTDFAIWGNVVLLLSILICTGYLLYLATIYKPLYETDRPVVK